jgi:DNA-binding response OmpR family regulator
MNNPGKILVVDDHLDLAENLAEILEGSGYETMIAGSAEAALDRIGTEHVSALLTDYRLPGKTGAELISELRRRGNLMPAIVMSAFTDDDTIAIARNAGAMDVLAKPIDLGLLFALMRALRDNQGLVLLVEDDASLAENMADALTSRGYRVNLERLAARAGQSSPSPQAAILDFNLPDGNGVEVANRLLSRDPGVRILFITGYAAALEDLLPGRLAEFARMEKPVDLAQMLAWVEHALGKAPTRPAS